MADNNFYTPGGVVGACEAERLQYYGDANIVPSDASLFSFETDEKTMTASVATRIEEFSSNPLLTDIVIPYKYINSNNEEFKIVGINNYSLYACHTVTSILIPNSVTSIGAGAFYKYFALTDISIPNSVTSIGDSAFYRCTGLRNIVIPNSVTSIGDRAFEECYDLTVICAEGSYADSYAKEHGIAVEYTN